MNKNLKTLLILFIFLITTAFTIKAQLAQKNQDNRIAGVKTVGRNGESKKIRGLIIPHHGLAKGLVDKSLNLLSQSHDYKYIVIFAPNHYFLEGATFTSTPELAEYSIPPGVIQNLKTEIPNLLLDKSIIENDHSITFPLIYIKRYYPNAHIIPVVFSNVFDPDELKKVATFFVNNLPEDTLFVASVDFTHETNLSEGLKNNEEAINAVSGFDYSKIYDFKDDHLDSPTAIANFLMIMEELNSKNWKTWENSHAAILENDPTISGTGYVIGVFY